MFHRSALSNGLQGDGSYHLNDPIRSAWAFSGFIENSTSDNTLHGFPGKRQREHVTGPPFTIVDNNSKNGNILCGALSPGRVEALDKLDGELRAQGRRVWTPL